jgi:hypothetical protein
VALMIPPPIRTTSVDVAGVPWLFVVNVVSSREVLAGKA